MIWFHLKSLQFLFSWRTKNSELKFIKFQQSKKSMTILYLFCFYWAKSAVSMRTKGFTQQGLSENEFDISVIPTILPCNCWVFWKPFVCREPSPSGSSSMYPDWAWFWLNVCAKDIDDDEKFAESNQQNWPNIISLFIYKI